MRADDAFFAAVLAAPDDDLPRLVYADYLDERGDPRGQLIRIQCLLARLSPADPDWKPLVEDQRQLLIDHQSDWLEPIRDSPHNWKFVRGFLEVRLDIRAFLRDGPALVQQLQVAAVNLYPHLSLQVAEVEQLTAFPLCRLVHGIYFGFEWLRDEGVRVLAGGEHWFNLRDLDLQYNGVRAGGAAVLAESAAFPRLHKLVLSHNDLGDDGAAALAASRVGATLTELNLSYAELGRDGAVALAESPALGGLTALHLHGNGLNGRTRPGRLLRRRYGRAVAW